MFPGTANSSPGRRPISSAVISFVMSRYAARSMIFLSSRTLPGKEYFTKASIADFQAFYYLRKGFPVKIDLENIKQAGRYPLPVDTKGVCG